MKNKYQIITILGIFLIAISCKRKEPTRWNVDGTAPIAYGKIGVEDLIPDSLIETDGNGILHFILNENLSDFDMDSLITIPDTTFFDFYGSPFISLPVTQGNSVFLVPIGIKESIMNIPTAELTQVIAGNGFINYTLKNFVEGEVLATYELPLVTKNGQTVYIEEIVPGGTFENPSVVTGSFDLSGFDFDLSGSDGDNHNIMVNDINVLANEDFTVPSQDTIFTSLLSFEGATVEYAKGYFGQHEINVSDTVDITAINNIIDGNLGIGEIDVNLSIENYVGIDGQIDFEELTSINTNNSTSITLDNPDLDNTINLTRAFDNDGSIVASVFETLMDENNSNIDEFIENLPNQLKTNIGVSINPLGDISLGNDFIYTNQPLQANLEIDLPLCVTLDNLTLVDTLEVNLDTDIEAEGKMTVYLINKFPLSAEITATLLDENENEFEVLIDEYEIPEGNYNSTTNEVIGIENVLTISIDNNTLSVLKNDGRISLNIKLNSFDNQEVKFTPDNYIDVKMIVQALTEISYD